MPKEKLIHTQSHVGRLLRAANEAKFRIAEIVFSPDGTIRMVPAEDPDGRPYPERRTAMRAPQSGETV